MRVFIVICDKAMKYKKIFISGEEEEEIGVTQFNIMMSVFCPSVIQREIDCLFGCCIVPIGALIS